MRSNEIESERERQRGEERETVPPGWVAGKGRGVGGEEEETNLKRESTVGEPGGLLTGGLGFHQSALKILSRPHLIWAVGFARWTAR